MSNTRRHRIEFGDFQTPDELAFAICHRLAAMGIRPDVVVEPTCGVGAFVLAAAAAFPDAGRILAFDVDAGHLDALRTRLATGGGQHCGDRDRIHVERTDFFNTDWHGKLANETGPVLVVGNFPWVTNTQLATISGENHPSKSNFQGRRGFDAISGMANFDISEWMLLEVLRWLSNRTGDVAMLVKRSVARKILAHTARQEMNVHESFLMGVDAGHYFGVAVDACLLIIRLSESAGNRDHDYTVLDDLDATRGRRVGHRSGFTVGDLDAFEATSSLLGRSPQKWRSGLKHDAASIMEFTRTGAGLANGAGELVDLEPTYLFPQLKGSDVGNDRQWHGKYVLVTQHCVGDPTDAIRVAAPRTWAYLQDHGDVLDARRSSIYSKSPRYSIFGIGDYAFRPWRIAVSGLYKNLQFRLVGPVDERPVMFDDTVYYLSFDTEAEAVETLDLLRSRPALDFLSSLIFWDDKRPIKSSILNALDWSRLKGPLAAPGLFAE